MRLATGGRIDRGRVLSFRFDGKVFRAHPGDTLASGLLANGVRLVGRSFKYHRPRGILAAGSDEPNALVRVRDTPNLRATTVELFDGLEAESQNRSPSLRLDVGAVNDVVAPVIPAGFYYKTFKWPAGFWKQVYEPAIRRAAGLGRAPENPDPDRYASRFAHCEVLVVGAGPAGLAAALAAASRGRRVILCDEQAEPGGSLLAPGEATIDGVPAASWLAGTLADLRRAGVTLLPRTTAFGYFPHNLVGLVERRTDHLPSSDDRPRERLWQVRAATVILATGAHERPLVFPGNDRPGVMLAHAARIYAERYAVLAGQRVVVAAGHDSAYHAALALHRAGARVEAIADRRERADGALPRQARAAGIFVGEGTTIAATRGRLGVSGVTLSGGRSIDCDLLLMGGGFTPSLHLFSQSRGKLRYDAASGTYLPGEPAEATRCVGACNGTFGLAAALDAGFAAGDAAAPRRFASTGLPDMAPAPPPGDAPAGKAFVDFQNDVTAKDLLLAAREGFRSIEHVKRYTTTGMATDQGKTSNLNTLAIVASTLGVTPPQVGLTTFRMPYTPTTFGALAGTSRGQVFDPVRTTPIHDCAVALGAVFEDVGQWKRARYFPRAGETMHQAVLREGRATRAGAGVFDASTLGKIEVVGPDAAEFLDRMYAGPLRKLAVGRCRYALLLREDGFILDDGIVARLAADRFHVTTTTGGAARVFAVMEDYRQTEFTDLRVWLTSITEQYATIAVQGPQARDIVRPLTDADLAMPHMSVAEAHVLGQPARVFRVSFTGELGFELNVPPPHAPAVWNAVLAAGAVPYGTEAMHVMRAEKGYVIVGQDTDGTVTPDDAGMAWAVGKNKPDFVGKRSLARAAMADPARKQLVGLLTRDPAIVLEEGAQLVVDPNQPIPMTMIGHVTSAYHSPALDRSIALAMVRGGRARIGATLHVPMPDRVIPVEVTAPLFYDAEGRKLDG
jgi:sarcosine oxidase subunit alpha